MSIVDSQTQKQEQEQNEQARQILARPKHVQRLIDVDDLPTFMKHLLLTQAHAVAGTEAAGFAVQPTPQGMGLRLIEHMRPDESPEEVRQQAIAAFQNLVAPAAEAGADRAVVVAEDGPEAMFCLITLLRHENQIVAATAVVTRCRTQELANQRLASMQLLAGYFDLFMMKRAAEAAKVQLTSHQDVLQYAASVASSEGFASASSNLCNELAARLGAARVAIGWATDKHIKLKAVSHTEEFDKKQELSLALVAAMEESWDQDEVVQFDPVRPEANSNNVTRDAAALSRMEGGHRVISLPLRHKRPGKDKQDADHTVGVMTLLFPAHKAPTMHETTSLAVAAEVLAPQLVDRYDNDRYLITKAGVSSKKALGTLVGPRHMLTKLIVASIVGFVVFVCVYSPMYHVKAPFSFQPIEKRTLAAPFAGIIKTVNVEPGQNVKAGDVLLTFDTRQLQLEKLEAEKEMNTNEQMATVAYASADERESSQYGIYLRRAEQAKARMQLAELKLEQAQITSPIDGEVIRGDLKQMSGSTVEQGQQLFEIAPRGSLRAELLVNERDITDVNVFLNEAEPGTTGKLATTARPDQKYDFVVDRVVGRAEATGSSNAYKVYGRFTGDVPPTWRVGMEGEARVDVNPQPLVWQWTHRLVEWVRLKLWM